MFSPKKVCGFVRPLQYRVPRLTGDWQIYLKLINKRSDITAQSVQLAARTEVVIGIHVVIKRSDHCLWLVVTNHRFFPVLLDIWRLTFRTAQLFFNHQCLIGPQQT